MSESLIVFSREWAVTSAVTSLLSPLYTCPVLAVYGLSQLTSVLREQPRSSVILGLRPHEHVADLYRLQPLLTGRAVMFVSRFFYWVDYSLPEWYGQERYGFCTWDALQDPFSRRMELRRFRLGGLTVGDYDPVLAMGCFSSPDPFVTEVQILEMANRWLYRKLSEAGLTGDEIRVLLLMTEGRKGNMSSRARSLHKNNGLYKLGMTKHITNLYRGVKVRAQLQSTLASLAEASLVDMVMLLIQEPSQ